MTILEEMVVYLILTFMMFIVLIFVGILSLCWYEYIDAADKSDECVILQIMNEKKGDNK